MRPYIFYKIIFISQSSHSMNTFIFMLHQFPVCLSLLLWLRSTFRSRGGLFMHVSADSRYTILSYVTVSYLIHMNLSVQYYFSTHSRFLFSLIFTQF